MARLDHINHCSLLMGFQVSDQMAWSFKIQIVTALKTDFPTSNEWLTLEADSHCVNQCNHMERPLENFPYLPAIVWSTFHVVIHSILTRNGWCKALPQCELLSKRYVNGLLGDFLLCPLHFQFIKMSAAFLILYLNNHLDKHVRLASYFSRSHMPSISQICSCCLKIVRKNQAY